MENLSAKQHSQTVVPVSTMEANIEKTLKHCGKWEEARAQFAACQNDTERLRVILRMEELIPHICPEVICQGKSMDKAESLRSQGNEHFRCARYEQALGCYSDAVRFAPHPLTTDCCESSGVLALCYGNRSAAFFHLKQFRCCLIDIDNALQAGFPGSSLHKLLDRQGKCHLFLKQKQPAIQAFQAAKQSLLSTSTLQDKARQDMICLTEQFIARCKGLEDRGSSELCHLETMIHEPVPQLMSVSSQIPSAADFVEMREEKGHGRGLYALKDIKIGEVLIVERPYASVVLEEYCLSHCHHCCTRCLVPLPCQHCVDIVFCSTRCRQASSSYHCAECGQMELLHQADVRLGHLALKMVAKAGFPYLLEHRRTLEEAGAYARSGFNDRGVYDSEHYPAMYYLLGHGEKRMVDDLWTRAVKAAFLVKCLEKGGFFPARVETEQHLEELSYIGGHVLRHLMMLPCNAHEVSEMGVNWQDPSQSRTLEIGSAIYPVLSLINHSCDPSVVRHSYGDTCVVRAVRGVRAGEELLDNYGALYPVMDRKQRQEHLLHQYFFSCDCQACREDWPIYMDIPKELTNFRCIKCHFGQVPLPGIAQVGTVESVPCADCGHRQNIQGLILKVGRLEMEFQQLLYQVIFSLQVGGETLAHLVHFLRVVDRHIHRPITCHNDCQEAIKMCYAYRANAYPRKVAIEHSSSSSSSSPKQQKV